MLQARVVLLLRCDPTIYVSGTKWIDSNCDSIGDSYGSGWTIYLYDDNHNIIDSAITDINGFYSFAIPADSFPNGNFYVGEVAQSGYTAYNGHDEFYLTGLGQNGSQSVTVDFLNCVCINTTGTSAIDTCDSYTWNGLAITVSGNYTQTFSNVAGCDSVHTLVVTIDYANTGTSYITACDSSSWNGQLITASGDYTQIFTNVAGCDSVHTLFVIINNSDSVSSTIDTCDSYTWNGLAITVSGNYTQTFTNVAGCDSVHTLIVTIDSSTTSYFNVTSCDDYVWNGITYTTTGIYTFSTTNSKGCDSTATLNLSLSNLEVMITDTCREINNSTSVDDIYVTINGGIAPYTYTWSVSILGIQIPFSTITSNQPYTSLIGVSDGDYCLSITDANGCILDTCIVANCHCCLVITDVVDTCLVGGGDLEVSVFGGNSSNSYTYTWTSAVLSNIPSSNHISNLPNGVYYLHVEEDSSHCFLDTTFVVNCPCNLVLSAIDTCIYDAITNSNLGSINLTVSGGSGNYSYSWTATNGFTASTQNISNLIIGPTYCVIVTDLNDTTCTDTLCVEISGCTLPCNLVLSATDTCMPGPVVGQYYGSIDLAVTGGSTSYSYYWTGPNIFIAYTPVISNLADGIYTVGVGDLQYPNCNNVWLSVTISCNASSPVCSLRTPTGLSVTDLTHDRAKVNWSDANTSLCLVEMYRVQYRELGTTAWSTKTALGSGLCNFGLTTTSKMLWNLTPSTIYEYRVKAWYCLSSASPWSSISTFTTEDVCANILNLAVSSPLTTRATFTWTAPSAPYSFVRIKLRVDTLSSAWFTAGGFGVMYPALTRNKNGLTPGQSYRASSRTWCNPLGGPHKALSWSSFIYWTQPGTLIRIDSENSSIENLTIYPNPSRDIFNITFISEEKQNLRVRILNVIGEEVYKEDLQQFVGEYVKSINLEQYNKAIYFLEIETDDGVINKKLILQ